MANITTFLMFAGKAEEAMNFYTGICDGAQILSLTRYGADVAGMEGKVLQATFSLFGQTFMCIDSPVQHAFTFTPSISLYVTCDTEAQIDRLYAGLSEDGSILMPLAEYPFSKKFGWLNDRYGVSWQLALGGAEKEQGAT